MQLRNKRSIVDNKYYVVIETSYTVAELDLMAHYGEPTVNVGGTITNSTSITYEESDQYVAMNTGFPWEHVLDGRDFVDADARSYVWYDVMAARIATEIGTLKAKDISFVGSDEVTI